MLQEGLTDDSPGSYLFPEFCSLYGMIASEVDGLTEEQLDFESQEWDWSKWSIRRQLCHMASVPVGWLLVTWGETLFHDASARSQGFHDPDPIRSADHGNHAGTQRFDRAGPSRAGGAVRCLLARPSLRSALASRLERLHETGTMMLKGPSPQA